MQIPKFNNNIISILYESAVSEYTLPDIPNLINRKLFDGAECETTLELAMPEASREEIETLQNNAHANFLKKHQNGYIHTHSDFDTHSDIFMLTIWEPTEDLVNQYLDHILNHITDLWDNMGGDGDYFDYLPSISDILFQLCETFKSPKQWDQFMEYINTDNPDAIEDALYRTELS